VSEVIVIDQLNNSPNEAGEPPEVTTLQLPSDPKYVAIAFLLYLAVSTSFNAVTYLTE
jgi:hypothetical protein